MSVPAALQEADLRVFTNISAQVRDSIGSES